jgi:acyl carrier protein
MSEPPDQTLQEIFRAVFNLAPDADVTTARQLTLPQWDSLAHVTLMGAVESEFGLEIDLVDQLELTSYEAVAAYLEERGG